MLSRARLAALSETLDSMPPSSEHSHSARAVWNLSAVMHQLCRPC